MKMSAVWNEIRRVGKNFQGGLTNLFFEENQELARLTKEYGIF